mmetsp:Transcript_37831/g.80101  ORF Transcript_37831/g.80101 Transcript_37831/m.80101 type:complete len:321 (+) Transcript_37831:773-1735(+)
MEIFSLFEPALDELGKGLVLAPDEVRHEAAAPNPARSANPVQPANRTCWHLEVHDVIDLRPIHAPAPEVRGQQKRGISVFELLRVPKSGAHTALWALHEACHRPARLAEILQENVAVVQTVHEHDRFSSGSSPQQVHQLIYPLIPIVASRQPLQCLLAQACGQSVEVPRLDRFGGAKTLDDHVASAVGADVEHGSSSEDELCGYEVRQPLLGLIDLANFQPGTHQREDVEEIASVWTGEEHVGLVHNHAGREDVVLFQLLQLLAELRRGGHNEVDGAPSDSRRREGVGGRGRGGTHRVLRVSRKRGSLLHSRGLETGLAC